MTEVTVKEIVTGDGKPTLTPYRVSGITTKDELTFKLSVTASTTIRAVRVRLEATNRNSGKLLYSRGMVCGTKDVCGSETARTLAVASPFNSATITIKAIQLAPEPDGEYDIESWALADEGWS